jgi:sugar phosphate isomerase/epimerase
LKQAGISVTAITTNIVDADTPNAEAILYAATKAGIKYYSWGGFKYDTTKPYAPQLDALKPRIQKLSRLNQKYGMKALYQPQRGPENVGSLFVDLLDVFKEFDPKFIAFRYDTAALLQVTNDNFLTHMRLGGAYIGGVALNDAKVSLELPVWNEGPFLGNPRQLLAPSGGGDNQGNAGGNFDAIGGGGRALPYRYRPLPVGTGMIDLMLIGKTLKEMNFSGPAEAQINWELDGVEKGGDKITYPRQEIIGHLKRDRLIIEQAFKTPWKIDVAQPAFMARQDSGAAPAPGRGGAGGDAN